MSEAHFEPAPEPAPEPDDSRQLKMLAVLAAVSMCLYGAIAVLSWRFDYHQEPTRRPILLVLLLFAAAFAAYLLAIRAVGHAARGGRVLGLIIWPAVIFRLILLFSVPIQEIDIYRYLWDGQVSKAGVSPFEYSPARVRSAEPESGTDQQLRTLVELRDRRPAVAEILRRVHFGELPTIYPPVSQAVFRAAAATTPAGAPVMAHVFIMKLWFIGFDLATLVVVIALLKLCRKPVGLCILYAWCPLVLKEVANSGHLDAVAVFLSALAVYLAAELIAGRPSELRAPLVATARATLMALVLAAAVGAKLYPVVLAPLLFLAVAPRVGWHRMLAPAVLFAATTLLILWPMLPRQVAPPAEARDIVHSKAAATPPPRPAAARSASTTDPSDGVATFLRRWEMNDFIFLLLIENLKSTEELPPDRTAWFSILPETARGGISATVASLLGADPRETPFLTARLLTGFAFLVVALALARRAARSAGVADFCEAGFLTLAWFWLLCPTQNPWYWTWALPLLPFARSRAWLAVSGLALLYYLRFWLSYHWPDTPVAGTRYAGPAFFDFIVTWLEFGPWLLWLALGWALTRKAVRETAPPAPADGTGQPVLPPT